jgi:L-alanine-DL-glutamate epimerase-like enolase superfamily enzyme
MKITAVDTFMVQGLAYPWCFCAVRTDDGITGYSEFGFGRMAHGLTGLVLDLAEVVVGKDPLAVARRYEELRRFSGYAMEGATQQAIAGIELALWDIKGKEAGKPVHALLGGPTREWQRVYWSHLGSYQNQFPEKLGREQLQTWDDLRALVRRAVDAGYTALKTNMIFLKSTREERRAHMGHRDKNMSPWLVENAVEQIAAMRDEAGEDIGIALDVNMNFRPEGQVALAQALEPYHLMWLEIDSLSAPALRHVRESTRTSILTGERMLGIREVLPYLQQRAMDILKLDVQWQGLLSAYELARLADHFEYNVAPHNFNGHLSSFQSLNLCATLNNVRICESDPVNAPWRDECFTVLPEIHEGRIRIPTAPGWGTELDEAAARRYAVGA